MYAKDKTLQSDQSLLKKMNDCSIFSECIRTYDMLFKKSTKVLELGGGQGWASAVVKKIYPSIEITLTDRRISTINSRRIWEQIFRVSIDNAYNSLAHHIRERDSSIDLVFCYAAAHHFRKHRQTLKEIYRILKSKGSCLYLHEPSTSKFFYPLALKRVNMKNIYVYEDVLIHSKIKQISESLGFTCFLHFYPTLLKRKIIEKMYYYILGKSKFLQTRFPCTVNYLFFKD